MKHFLFHLVVLFSLVGCATTKNRNIHEKVRKEAKAGKIDAALAIVNSSDFYPDAQSALLRLMEGSLLQHLNGNYYQAQLGLDRAKDLSDELFTVSISKEVASALTNDNEDNYYGETYERSMIRFYQVVNHYSLFLKGSYEAFSIEEKDEKGKVLKKKDIPAKTLSDQERRFHLTAARASLIEWNSLIESYKGSTGGRPVYKDDLLAKIFGAFIHEQIGTVDDRSIALNLYKEAKNVLLRNYSILPTYNKKSSAFVDNFSKFGEMDQAAVVAKFIEKTPHFTNLEKFIDEQITRLSKGKSDSVLVIIENNFIAHKEVKKFDFPIPVNKAPTAVAGGDFITFAAKIVGAAVNTVPKIYFEMSEIKPIPIIENQMIVVKDESGKVVQTKNLVTLNPMSDLAHFVLSENALSNYAKVGTRVALKHVAAIAAAYTTYQQTKGKSGETIAFMVASSLYAGANKGIEASEQADIRGWNMLPHMFSTAGFDLKPGTYEFEYKQNESVQSLGKVIVGKDKLVKSQLLKKRVY